jgi:zinc protease
MKIEHFTQINGLTNTTMTNPLPFIMLCLVLAPTSDAQNNAAEQPTIAQKVVAMPTVGNVLTNYINAIGGTAAWEKVISQWAKGTYANDQMGPGSHVLEVYKKAPDKWIFTIRDPDGSVFKQGFNGKHGWNESGELEPDQVALFGHLLSLRCGIDLPRFLPTMRFLEQSKVGNSNAFVIAATIIEGKPEKLYFDTSSGLLIQEDFGAASLYYEDYREVDGVKVAFGIRQEGSPSWTIRFKEIKHNLPIEDSKFDRPKSH